MGAWRPARIGGMSWDLNRQAKVFLLSLGVPWLLFVLAAVLVCVSVGLQWLGVLRAYAE
jgi:hypothetical protein